MGQVCGSYMRAVHEGLISVGTMHVSYNGVAYGSLCLEFMETAAVQRRKNLGKVYGPYIWAVYVGYI